MARSYWANTEGSEVPLPPPHGGRHPLLPAPGAVIEAPGIGRHRQRTTLALEPVSAL